MNRQTIVAGLSKLQASRIATLTANERLLEDSLLPVSQEIEMLQRKQEETLIDLSKTFAKIKNAEASFLDQVIESLAKKRRAAREEKERLEEAIRLKRLEAERLEQEQRDHEAALAQRMAQEEQARLAAEKEQRLAAERQRDQMSQYEKVYEPYVSQYEQLRTSYHPEKIDSTLRLEIKMKLNKRVSQVSPSKAQVLGIVKDLDNVLNMAKAASNEMYAYALELLYEKVMAQGQAQVALNVPSAFPLSALIVTLSQSQSPPFIQCLFGKLVKECSFVAGEMPSPLSVSVASVCFFLLKVLIVWLHICRANQRWSMVLALDTRRVALMEIWRVKMPGTNARPAFCTFLPPFCSKRPLQVMHFPRQASMLLLT